MFVSAGSKILGQGIDASQFHPDIDLAEHSVMGAGSQVPYLAAHYANYRGPQMLPHRARAVRMLIQQHFKHKDPPPAPFDQGVLQNLNSFFFEPKPIAYHKHHKPAPVGEEHV